MVHVLRGHTTQGFLRHDVAVAAGDRLRSSPYLPVRRIVCDYQEGVLFLRGRSPSFFYKQLAQETVGKVSGVIQVVNEIEVDPTTG